jgi:hypothetical protein
MKALLVIINFLLLGIGANAGNRIVTSTNNSGIGSLRAEIDSAQSGDTIRFSPILISTGTDSIVLTSRINISKSLVIIGLYNSSDSLFISGGGTNQIFYITNTFFFTLDSLIFQNGKGISSNGGAVYFNIDGDITISNCIFRNNQITNTSSSSHGAGFYALTDSSIFIKNCQLTSNKATQVRGSIGGGALLQGKNVTVENCLIKDNSITSLFNSAGGGIASFFKDKLNVSDNIFINNETRSTSFNVSNGGGLFASSSGSFALPSNSCQITNNTFTNNSTLSSYSTSSGAAGGGIYIISNRIIISNNLVKGNSIYTNGDLLAPSAFARGGGIFAKSTNQIQILNNDIDSNIVTSVAYKIPSGGAIFAEADSSILIKNTSVTRNHVKTTKVNASAGGIFAQATYGQVTIENCFIDSNKVTSTYNTFNRSSLGGGIELFFAGKSTIKNSTISNNTVEVPHLGGGGGIYANSYTLYSKLSILNSTISGNKATTLYDCSGGGIFSLNYVKLDIQNSSLIQNSCTSNYDAEGGGIKTYFLGLKNSTIYLNKAISTTSNNRSFGNGIYFFDTLSMKGNIIHNAYSNGTNIYKIGFMESLGFNVFNDSMNRIYPLSDSLQIDSASLNLALLGLYGGTTKTCIPLMGSIAMNTGDSSDLSSPQNKPIFGIRDRGAAENNCNTVYFITDSVCGFFTSVSGKVWNISGNYSDTVTNGLGCDTIYYYNLVLNQPYDTVTITTCDSYLTNSGKILNSSGTFYDTNYNRGVCDTSITTIYLTLPNSSSVILNITACSNYLLPNGRIITQSGTYLDTLSKSNGCDSILTFNLIINNSSILNNTVQVCNSYFWPFNGVTYTRDTIIRDTLFGANSFGCDSIGYLILIVNNSAFSNQSISSCDSYRTPSGRIYTTSGTIFDTISTHKGCDSIITINLTITTIKKSYDSISTCFNYTWSSNGQTYWSDTSVFDTIFGGSSVGCDSIVSLTITIKTIDPTVSIIYPSLKSNQDFATYQWLDCNDSFAPISGETFQWFTLQTNGSYAVEITRSGCVDTSACNDINNVRVEKNEILNSTIVYPNPAFEKISIELGDFNATSIAIYDIKGKMIISNNNINSNTINLDINEFEEGIYIIKVIKIDETKSFRILKLN